MPYSSSGKLPGELASKLGHLAVINNEWVRKLIQDFEDPSLVGNEVDSSIWNECDISEVRPLQYIWAVDGSFVPVKTNPPSGKEVAFIKTALLSIDKAKLKKIDRYNPHPLLLQDIMAESALFHATVLPLKNVKTSMGSNYEAVRHIIYESMKIDEDGSYFETLKWLAYRKWSSTPYPSLSFDCPHCAGPIDGLPYNSDSSVCAICKKEIFLTDMIGFHLDMSEDNAPDSVASSYMLILELLMLFTIVRLLWDHSDKNLFSDALFIKDGPLTLRSQYSKLVPSIREFINFTLVEGRPIHIIGQEKTGVFSDHLKSIARFVSPMRIDDNPSFAVLSHEYVRRDVYRTPELPNPYGKRTNWGEKVYVKIDPDTSLVLNVPTGNYSENPTFPQREDLIGFDRIFATLPEIISRKFEGALFPIELANGVASMSNYPSSKILERFLESKGS